MPNDDFIIAEAIRLVGEGVSVTLPVNGQSMLPFIIGGKESVILQKSDELEVGHVVLAWADDSHYVVHRIVGIDAGRLTLMGDGNLSGKEYCKVTDVKAKVSHVVGADGQMRYLYTKKRCRAAKVWWYLRPMRRILLAIYRRL